MLDLAHPVAMPDSLRIETPHLTGVPHLGLVFRETVAKLLIVKLPATQTMRATQALKARVS